MSISFISIPASLRTTGAFIEFDSAKAVSGLPAAPTKVLLIGQRLAAGTVAPGVATRIVAVDQAVKAFGRGSMLAGMAKAFKTVDALTECWAIALADLDGGTAAGTIALMIAGRSVKVGVAAGDTANAIAAAIGAAIGANPDLPVTATVANAIVTLAARHKGTCGNDIDLRHSFYQGEALPAGVGLTFAAMANGAGNPDIASIFAVIGDAAYSTIAIGFTDTATLTAVEAEMARRAGPMVMVEGMAYFGARGTQGALATLGGARNSPYCSIIGAKAAPNPTWEWAAAYAGVVGFHGAIDPARPFQTLPLTGLLAPAEPDRFTRGERELLLRDGISTWTADVAGAVVIERAITTYQTNAWGLDDVAYLDVNTPLTLAYLRFAVRARILAKYPRHKLAADDARFDAGQAIVTPKIIRAELVALFRELEEAGLVEDLDQFVADLIVERDATDAGQVNALIPPNIVNQFRKFAGRIEFRL